MPEGLYIPRGPVAIEGQLSKQSKWIKLWRTRYFTLSGNQLYFAASKGAQPHGVIDLKGCLTVKSAEEKCGKKPAFEVATPDQVYYMCADSEEEKDDWIG